MTIERIQLRRGTAQQWTDTNPILGAAEVGVELGTPNKFKMGDGSSTWEELAYFVDENSIPEVNLSGYATETFVTTAINNLVDSAPTALDTLNELALALGEDPDFATTIVTALGDKSDIGHTHPISEVVNLQSTIDDIDQEVFDRGNQLDSLEVRVIALESAPSPIPEVVYITDADLVSGPEVTLSSFYANKVLSISSTSNVDFYVLDEFQVGESVVIYNKNVGVINFLGAGVTIEGAGVSGIGLKLANRYSSATIFCESAGTYAIIGDVEIA